MVSFRHYQPKQQFTHSRLFPTPPLPPPGLIIIPLVEDRQLLEWKQASGNKEHNTYHFNQIRCDSQ